MNDKEEFDLDRDFSENTAYIKKMAAKSNFNNRITGEMYPQYNVKRGLRDIDGNGVVTGLTEISEIKAKEKDKNGNVIPCEGELFYRGINIRELTDGFLKDDRFGFEEAIYLLLFSELPDKASLDEFKEELSQYRSLPSSFVRDMILKAPGNNIMNIIARSVLALYVYDNNADDTSVENVLRQSLQLIAEFPLLSVYSYQAYRHYYNSESLSIHLPKPELSTSENILHILRGENEYSDLEAKILDLALVLHAEHGGGNNSSFTTHVVTSSGTDTYSAIAAALGSLKGPKHGGANVKVVKMFDDMKKNINVEKDSEIRQYIEKILDKQAYDGMGLVYGMGHAIYSKSDPRADILKKCAKKLSVEKNMLDEYELYKRVAVIASDVICQKRKIYKGVSPNVDFYSGMIYKMLELPYELYTPIFAMSRIAGWSAHRIEEIQNEGKIIRPAYIGVKERRSYLDLKDR